MCAADKMEEDLTKKKSGFSSVQWVPYTVFGFAMVRCQRCV